MGNEKKNNAYKTSLQNKICVQFFSQGSLRKNNLSSLSPGLHTLLEVNIYFDRKHCIYPLLKLKHCIKACLLGFYKCNINGLILNWVYIKFAICQVSWTRHTWERLPRGEMWTWHSMATTILTMIVFVYKAILVQKTLFFSWKRYILFRKYTEH